MDQGTRYIPLEECLYDALTNPEVYPPQEERQSWAIYEGFMRQGVGGPFDQNPSARAEHTCVRGCQIHKRETYYKFQYGPAFDSYIKVCASCTALALYLSRIWEDKPYMYTHWDEGEKRPVRLGK